MVYFLRELNSFILYLTYKLNLSFVPAFPEGVMVEPASICNVRCVLCPITKGKIKRQTNFLDFQVYKNIFRVSRYFIKYITFWNFGEPLLNKHLPEMVRYVATTGVNTQVSTNGQFFEKEYLEELLSSGLTKLIISIDTYNKNQYEKYRVGGNFDILQENIRKIIDIKRRINSKTQIVLQFLVTKENQSNVDEIKIFGNKFGADEIIIKTMGIGSAFTNPSKKEKDFLPTNHLLRYNKNLYAKKRITGRCKYMWFRTVICSDGSLLPCCRDQEGAFILGNVSKKSLLKEFNNKKYIEFRKDISKHQTIELMCLRCPEEIKKSSDIVVKVGSKEKNKQNISFKLD